MPLSASARRVVVCGAGPGGLLAATQLARHGRDSVRVTVLERNESAPHYNRGLGIWAPGQQALRAVLGSSAQARLGAHVIPPASYRSRGGAWLSSASGRDRALHRVWSVHAPTLMRELLLEARAAGVEVLFGHRAAAISESDGSLGGSLFVKAGGLRVPADLVVGADGPGSLVRRTLGPAAFRSHYGPAVCVGGLSRTTARTRAPPYETLQGGLRFAAIPLDDAVTFWFASLPRSALTQHRQRPGAFESDTVLAVVAGSFEQCHTEVRELISTTRPDTVYMEESYERAAGCRSPRVEERVFCGNRAVLIGDAANPLPPTMAQGASVALEDAHDLCHALVHGGWLEGGSESSKEALAAHARRRTDRARALAYLTAFTGLLGIPRHAGSEAMRNAIGLVPRPINEAVFDAALKFSFGGQEMLPGVST